MGAHKLPETPKSSEQQSRRKISSYSTYLIDDTSSPFDIPQVCVM